MKATEIQCERIVLTVSHNITISVLAIIACCLLSGATVHGSWAYDGDLERFSADFFDQNAAASKDFSDLRDSLSIGIVGRTDQHTILFSYQDSTLEPGGALILIFPDGFELTSLLEASYSDDDSLNVDLSIDTLITAGSNVEIRFDTTGSAPDSGSSIRIALDSIISSTTSGEYWVIATSVDSSGMLLAGPTISEPFSLEADSIESVEIDPDYVPYVIAGNTVAFSCAATDQFDNAVDDFETLWSVVNISEGYDPNGVISDEGVYLGLHSGPSKVFCKVSTGVDTLLDSAIVIVYHADFDHYTVSGFPESVLAGTPLTDSIVVAAEDLYGNLLTNFSTILWFKTSDPRASISPDSLSPDTFTPGIDGIEIYPGAGFVLRTAGLQQVTLTDTAGTSLSVPVFVEAGAPASFELEVPSHVIAGQEFTVTVTNLKDAADNLLDAVVEIELETDGISPGGDNPQLSSFIVSSGSGSAGQVLVMAETTAVRATVGSVSIVSDPVVVNNAAADIFTVEMSTPEIVGMPFGYASIHAFDPYGNAAVDFDASVDAVTITPDATGSAVPSRLDTDSSFIDGLCDLTRFDFKYYGQARFLTFAVESDSGVYGVSNMVEINSAKIEQLALDKEQYFEGETAVATVTITNFGSFETRIIDISLSSSQGPLAVTALTPELPDTIGGNESRDYELTTVIPVNFDPQMTSFSAAFSAFANQQLITDTSGYLDSARILSQKNLVYTDLSLSPQVISRGETYSFFCQVQHIGAVNVQLDTTSTMQFISDENDTFVTRLSNPIPIPASAQPITLFFEDKQIDQGFASGTYEVYLYLRGTQGLVNYSEDITLTDSILIQSPSSIRFVDGSFSPETAFRGMEIVPEITVVNDGEALLQLDVARSLLRLTADDDEIRFTIDETISTVIEGSTVLRFMPKTIRTSFPLTSNSLTLDLFGEENGHTQDISIDLGENLIDLLQQAAVRLVSLTAHAPNMPNINAGMEFYLTANVTNESEEELADISISFESDGSSEFEETMMLESLGVGETDSVILEVTASTEPNPSELFTASIISATGVSTGQDATVASPLDNTAAVNIQSAGLIELDARIDGPPAAVDGILSFGQTFHVAAEFANIGQANVGAGEITLSLPDPDFDVADPLIVSASVDEAIGWTITAPRKNGQFDLIVELTGIPLDSNSRLPAQVSRSADTIHVAVEEEDLKLRVWYEFYSADLVGSGEQLDLLKLSFTAVADNDESQIRIDEVALMLSDRNGNALDAADLFNSASVEIEDAGQYSGSLTADQIVFNIGDVTVSRVDTLDAVITVVMRDDVLSENFFVSIGSSGIDAIDFTFNVEGVRVVVLGRGDGALESTAGYGVVPAGLDASFYNYPNPFAAGVEETNIVYFLSQSTDITFEIFTLIGEKVFSKSVAAGDAGAREGMNALIWDGRNSRGDVVRNGVYIAVLSLGSGGEVRTKIAVVK